jgi:nucleotide-binding universal stress UspA family protein
VYRHILIATDGSEWATLAAQAEVGARHPVEDYEKHARA